MVNSRRVDHLINREYPIRDGLVNRREILRQRLIRDHSPIIRRLFIDRDEISDDIVRAINDEESSVGLSFAPLPSSSPEYTPPSPVAAPQEEEEDTESTTGYSDSLSDCPVVEIDLDVTDVRVPLSLLRGWERNAEIRPLIDVQTQTSPTPSSNYSPPNYSPVRLEDLEDDLEALEWRDQDCENISIYDVPEEQNPPYRTRIEWGRILNAMNDDEFSDCLEDLEYIENEF